MLGLAGERVLGIAVLVAAATLASAGPGPADDVVVLQLGGRVGAGVPAPALSGDGSRLVLGDWHGYAPDGPGMVEIFDWDGVGWTRVGDALRSPGEAAAFGRAVAVSADGDRVAVGDPGVSGGTVRVYDWNGTTWVQVGADIDGESDGDRSADSQGCLALSRNGARIAIGAPYNDGSGDSAGNVRVFDWDGTTWVQVGTDIEGRPAKRLCAVAMSADGARVIVGNEEHAHGYAWDGTDWVPLGAEVVGGWPIDVSADGNRFTAVAGGHVRVYDWDGAGWVPASNGALDGRRVALSDDGSRLVVGIPWPWATDPEDGLVRIFDWNGSAWNQVGPDLDGLPTGRAGPVLEGFGWMVAISGDGRRIAAGTAFDDGSMDGNGARAYEIVEPPSTTTSTTIAEPTPTVGSLPAVPGITLPETGGGRSAAVVGLALLGVLLGGALIGLTRRSRC